MRTTVVCAFVIFSAFFVSSQESILLKAPIATSQIEDNLVGPVKKVITETLMLNNIQKNDDWLLSVRIYNEHGYLIQNGSAKKIEGKPVSNSLFERVIDDNGLLLATNYNGTKVRYKYETKNNITQAIPINTSGEIIPYGIFYEVKKVASTTVVTASDSNDGVSSIRVYDKERNLLKVTIIDPFSGIRNEMDFHDGKIIHTRTTKLHAKATDTVQTATYEYDNGHLPTLIKRYENGKLISIDFYDYILDNKGNWIEYSMFRIDNNKIKKVVSRESRNIEYY